MRTRHQLATGLVVALSGASLVGPALASGQDLRSPDAMDAASAAIHSAPAVVLVQDLRSPDAVAAAIRAAAGEPAVVNPAVSARIHSAPAVVLVQDLRSPDAVAAAVGAAAGEPAVVNPAASQPSASSGFDWGSAAIGAAGTIGLIAVALGGGLMVHRRRAPVAPPPIAH
jgi:hypothetical protein